MLPCRNPIAPARVVPPAQFHRCDIPLRARRSAPRGAAIALVLALTAALAPAETLRIVSADHTVQVYDLPSWTLTTTTIPDLVNSGPILGVERSQEAVGCGQTICMQSRMRLVVDEGGATSWRQLDLQASPPTASIGCLIQGGNWYPNAPLVDYVRYGGQNPGDILAYSALIDEAANFYGGPTCANAPGGPTYVPLSPTNAQFAGAVARGDRIYVLRNSGSLVLSRIDVTVVGPGPNPPPPYAVGQTWNVVDLVGNMGSYEVMGMTLDADGHMWAYVNRPQSCQGHGWGDLVIARTDETIASPTLTLRTIRVVGSWFNGGVGCLYFPRAWLFFDPVAAPTSINPPAPSICSDASVLLTANGGSGGVVQWFRDACGTTSAGPDGPTLTVSPTITTTYYARWHSAYSGDSSCQPVTVTVNPSNRTPTMYDAQPRAVCSGSPVALTANGSGGTLRWYTDRNDPLSIVGQGSPATVYPTSTTTVTRTYHGRWESATCLPSGWISVEVDVRPNTAITSWPDNPVLCEGSNATLSMTAEGADPLHLEWYLNGVLRSTSTTITLSPVSPNDAGEWVLWAVSPCGSTPTRHFTVDVLPLSAPDSILVQPEPSCASGFLTLTAQGGSGERMRWCANSENSTPLPQEGASITIPAPASDTLYFARWETVACGQSPSTSVLATVRTPPTNTDCALASSVNPPMVGAPVSIAFDTTCVPEGFSPDFVHTGVWFTFLATETGRGAAIVSGTAYPGRVAVWENVCGSTDYAKLNDQAGLARFPMRAGRVYSVHVGSTNGLTGPGTLTMDSAPVTPCPPAHWEGASRPYTIASVQAGQSWSWRITASDASFGPIEELALPGFASSDISAAAAEFAARINAVVAQTCAVPTISATANQLVYGGTILQVNGALTIQFRQASPTSLLLLSVGSGGTPTCGVTVGGVDCSTSFLLPPVFDMHLEPYSAADCNGNGQSDQLDIALGAAPDVNGDQIPDTCSGTIGNANCTGDGFPMNCPCGNNSAWGDRAGCLNSLGLGGRLTASGFPNLAHDTLVLTADGMPNSSALYFQGTLNAQSAFGDGLRCAGGSVLRLGTHSNVQGASSYPTGAEAPVSVRGQVVTPGSVRRYQVWYRNAANYCTASTFNLSNGLEILWLP